MGPTKIVGALVIRPRSAIQSIQECFNSIEETEWIVHRLIERNTLGQIYSDWNVGKSALAVDIACHVATGTPFYGRAVEKGPVLYIASEGSRGLVRRFLGWQLKYGIRLPSSIYLTRVTMRLPDAPNEKVLKEVIREIEAKHGQAPILVVIDTHAQTMVGEQNSTSDVDRFTSLLRQLFEKSTIMLLHHVGHGEKTRSRGASSLPAACDWEFRLEEAKSNETESDVIKYICLKNTKQRDEEQQPELCFSLIRTVLATDNHDQPITTVVARAAPNYSHGQSSTRMLGRTTKAMLNCLESLIGDSIIHPDCLDLSDPIKVTAWRDKCLASGYSSDNFRKTKQRILEKGLISVRDDLIVGIHLGQP